MKNNTKELIKGQQLNKKSWANTIAVRLSEPERANIGIINNPIDTS